MPCQGLDPQKTWISQEHLHVLRGQRSKHLKLTIFSSNKPWTVAVGPWSCFHSIHFNGSRSLRENKKKLDHGSRLTHGICFNIQSWCPHFLDDKKLIYLAIENFIWQIGPRKSRASLCFFDLVLVPSYTVTYHTCWEKGLSKIHCWMKVSKSF